MRTTHKFLHVTQQLISRARKEFETFMDEDQFKKEHEIQLTVLQTMAKIGPHADPDFRDECMFAILL